MMLGSEILARVNSITRASNKYIVFVCTVILIIIVNCKTRKENSTSFIAGMYYNVQKVENLIYCTTGRGIEIYSFNNKSPQLISRYATDGISRACNINNHFAYIADDYKGLCILDVSNPKNIKQINSFNTKGQVRDIYIRGNYAYIADYDRGFIILDISNPTSIHLVSSCSNIDCACWVKVKDTLAFVGVMGGPFKIIDISDPMSPNIIGEFPRGANSYCSDIYFDDTMAYLNCRISMKDSLITFAVFNMKDPLNPQFVSGLSLPSTGQGLLKTGNLIYASTYNEGIFIIDITNPIIPKISGHYKISNYYGTNIIFSKNYLIIPHLIDGFSIVDIKDYKKPKEVFHLQNIRWEYLIIDDSLGYMYLLGNTEDINLNRHSYLQVVDVSDPEMPICINELSFSGNSSFSDGSYDYPFLLVTNRQGHPRCDTIYTIIIDVHNPREPRVKNIVKGGGIIEFHSPTILALDHNNIKKGDINKPNIWINNLDLHCRGNDFVVKDSFIYIITKDSLIIVSVNSPKRKGGFLHKHPNSGNISFEYPYLVSTYSYEGKGQTYGFMIFNVQNKETPSMLVDTVIYGDTTSHISHSLFSIIYSMSCQLKDSLLFFGRGVYGFDTWKIKQPGLFTKIFTQETPYIATHCYPPGNGNIHFYKNHIFLIDFPGSLEIFDIHDYIYYKHEKS
jgi:hypothetical protein